jgi:hypothetical protein
VLLADDFKIVPSEVIDHVWPGGVPAAFAHTEAFEVVSSSTSSSSDAELREAGRRWVDSARGDDSPVSWELLWNRLVGERKAAQRLASHVKLALHAQASTDYSHLDVIRVQKVFRSSGATTILRMLALNVEDVALTCLARPAQPSLGMSGLWRALVSAASRHEQQRLVILFDDNVRWVESFIADFRPDPGRCVAILLVRMVPWVPGQQLELKSYVIEPYLHETEVHSMVHVLKRFFPESSDALDGAEAEARAGDKSGNIDTLHILNFVLAAVERCWRVEDFVKELVDSLPALERRTMVAIAFVSVFVTCNAYGDVEGMPIGGPVAALFNNPKLQRACHMLRQRIDHNGEESATFLHPWIANVVLQQYAGIAWDSHDHVAINTVQSLEPLLTAFKTTTTVLQDTTPWSKQRSLLQLLLLNRGQSKFSPFVSVVLIYASSPARGRDSVDLDALAKFWKEVREQTPAGDILNLHLNVLESRFLRHLARSLSGNPAKQREAHNASLDKANTVMRQVPRDDLETGLLVANNKASVLREMGRYEEAAQLVRESWLRDSTNNRTRSTWQDVLNRWERSLHGKKNKALTTSKAEFTKLCGGHSPRPEAPVRELKAFEEDRQVAERLNRWMKGAWRTRLALQM